MPQQQQQQTTNGHNQIPLLDQHEDDDWKDLPKGVRTSAESLRYTETLWNSGVVPAACELYWKELTETQRRAVKNLGYSQETWDVEDSNSDDDSPEGPPVLEVLADERWSDLPTWIRAAAKELGYTPNRWKRNKEPDALDWGWRELTRSQRQAAKQLGYNKRLWDGDESLRDPQKMPTTRTNRFSRAASAADDPSFDVIIIGAGWAGIGAGLALHQNESKCSFTILEGRHEIGGRCRTVQLDDGKSIAELGAQWVQDSYRKQENPVRKWAKEMNMEVYHHTSRNPFVLYAPKEALERSSGSISNSSGTTTEKNTAQGSSSLVAVSNKDYQRKRKELARTFWKYRTKRKRKFSIETSLEDCLQEFLQQKHMSSHNEAWLRYFLDTEAVVEYSASLPDLSCKHFDNDNDNVANMHLAQKIGGGYKALIDYAATPVLERIQCNAKVKAIDWKNNENDWVTVHYHCGRSNKDCVLKARKVLVTVPLGVLKANTIAIRPPLPHRKQYAIDKMGYGCLNKCILLWDDAQIPKLPWPKDKEWLGRLVLENNDTLLSQNDAQGIWTEFFNLYPVNGRPMLMAFLAGENAVTIEETYTDDQIEREVMQTLRKWFGSSLPGPKQTVVTRWHRDEFSFGSYSYTAVGMTPVFRDWLADPVEGRLYFAGEACHASYPSTTLGACLSGQSVGTRIANALSSGSRSSSSRQKRGWKASRLFGRI